MPGIVKTTGMVLTRYDWGNTSRIFTLLTPDRGRVSLLLKGARRPRGRPGLGGGLDLLSENEILYYQRRSGLAVLAEWSEISSPYDLGRDPVRLAAAEACAEFARECAVEGDGDSDLYALLTGGLELIRRAERLVPLTLSVALGMLRVAGFRPEAGGCVGCGVELAGEKGQGRQVLSAAEGGMLCRRCGREGRAEDGAPRLSAEAAALLGALVRLEPQAAARLRPSRGAERELLRAVSYYASWRLERRIRGLTGLNSIITGLEAVGCR